LSFWFLNNQLNLANIKPLILQELMFFFMITTGRFADWIGA